MLHFTPHRTRTMAGGTSTVSAIVVVAGRVALEICKGIKIFQHFTYVPWGLFIEGVIKMGGQGYLKEVTKGL